MLDIPIVMQANPLKVNSMSNLSYCRFRNTRPDLTDCVTSLFDEVSEEENRARKAIILKCIEVAKMFANEEFTINMKDIDELPVEEQ